MKKKTAAITHISKDPGPNFAVVPRCLRPSTATRLNKTRSRNLSARTSFGAFCVVAVAINRETGDEMNYSESTLRWFDKDEQISVSAPRRSIANCTGEAFDIDPLEIFGAEFCWAEIEFYFFDRPPEIFREDFHIFQFRDDRETIVSANIHAVAGIGPTTFSSGIPQ